MSTTTLTRSEQVLAAPTTRVRALVHADSAKSPRRGRRGRTRPASRRPAPRALDVYVRSVSLWGRSYR